MPETIKQNGFTRRSFIKGAVVGAGTAAMVGLGLKRAGGTNGGHPIVLQSMKK